MRPSANPQGNPRGSLLPVPEPAPNILPPPEAPTPPAHLNDYGRSIWFHLWDYGKDAYNPNTDQYVIGRYCSLQQRREELLSILALDGFLTEGSQGQTVAHPAAKLLESVERLLLPLEDRLGLSPEARIRLGIGANQYKSALDTFLEEED